MYQIKLKISYKNYSTDAILSNEKIITFNPTKISPEKNNNNGRDEKKCTGNLEITGDDYIDLMSWDDELNYLFDIKFSLYENGILIVDESRNIELVNNNKDFNKATFNLIDNINDIYDTIYKYWSDESDIIGVTPVKTLKYTNNRSVISKTTTDLSRTFDCLKNEDGALIADVQAYIDTLLADTEWSLSQIIFSYVSGDCPNDTLTLDVSMSWLQIVANGYYQGTIKIPPAGIDWIYKDDVTVDGDTHPRFMKPIYTYNRKTYELRKGKNCVLGKDLYYFYGYVWSNEHITTTVDYTDVARKVEDVIEFLIDEIDSSIAFDSNSFYSFDNYTGQTEASGYGTSSYEYPLLIGLTDFIPDISGYQKENPQAVLYTSLRTILQKFESIGFYWYMEEISSVYYFRLRLIEDKALLTGNPILSNYYGNDWTYLSNNHKVNKYSINRIENQTLSSDYNFSAPYFDLVYSKEKKTRTLSDGNIFTDVDYIVDSKSTAFDEVSTNNMVMVAASLDTLIYYIRQTEGYYTGLPAVNNNEFSFSYLVGNTFANLPAASNLSSLGDNMSKAREEKINELDYQIPVESFYTDFDYFKYVLIRGNQYEIDNMKKTLADNFVTIVLKK